jgi:hypothetical protein
MTRRLSGEFGIDLPLSDAVAVCAEAVRGLGWEIEELERDRILTHAHTGSQHPPTVEVLLRESGRGTDVRIVGTDSEAEPLSREALAAELDRVSGAIGASVEGRRRIRPPAAPPARAPAPAPGPRGAPAPGPPQPRWLVAAIAGLVAIGLAVVAIALINDSDDQDLGADGSAGQTNPAQNRGQAGSNGDQPGGRQGSQASQGEGSAGAAQSEDQEDASSPDGSSSDGLGLGDGARIRDGDQLFLLTPTAVDREGDHVIVEIEVEGLGRRGYDGSGRAFLATLFGSNGRRYQLDSSGPAECGPPAEDAARGTTLDGCLPFAVPEGVEPDRLRYDPFFVGDKAVEWDLE